MLAHGTSFCLRVAAPLVLASLGACGPTYGYTTFGIGADGTGSGQTITSKTPWPVFQSALPTHAESTSYRETSTYAHVVTFIDSLTKLGKPMSRGSIGTTNEGRAIPYVVASRPLFATPDAARRSGRPIVYVQGNIHAGEVEGKEVLQALLRDLLIDPRPNVLDSIVLVAVPIYNADGNEKFADQARNRGAQNGPAMVGVRPNAQGLDLNRDYMKLDSPEARASLAMFNTWDPHVFVDLHTTNGSYHGYALTYAPSLNPAAELAGATFGGAYARDSLLPELKRRVQARHGFPTFDYGDYPRDSVSRWTTFDHRPRFGTNYYALRGRVSILSEAYSHDPFEKRVRSTYAFTKELLSLVAERRNAVRALATASDARLREVERRPLSVPVRSMLTRTPPIGEISVERVERRGDSTRYEAGMPFGARRTGEFRNVRVPLFTRFDPVLTRETPWGYAIAPDDTAAIRLAREHGLRLERVRERWEGDAGPQFVADSTVIAPQPFQNRREVRLVGRWVDGPRVTLEPGTVVVRVAQPLGVVAMYLLDPESDDGVVTWDIGGRAAGRGHGIVRLARAIPTRPEATR
jgi:hypothetical protein